MNRGLLRLTVLAAVVAAALPLSAQIFRGGIDVVSLNITVTESDKLVPGLDQSLFAVYEDGVQQEISFFSRAAQPIALSLLIDTSTSMETKLGVAQEGAIGFAKRLTGSDAAQIIDFDSRVDILQPFTNDPLLLESAIRKTQVGGSTSLYNAIYVALSEMKRVRAASKAEIRRQAVVILSDGEDTSSLIAYEDVLESSKRSEVAVYAIGLRSKTDRPTRGFNEADFGAAHVVAGNRRPRVFCRRCGAVAGDLPAHRRRTREPVHDWVLVKKSQT